MANLKLVEKDMETDKQKALAAALTQIDRAFGKGSVMRLGEKPVVEIESISTGSLSLDIALGIGGLPKGRIIEIYGPESSGKTTLALHVIAEAVASKHVHVSIHEAVGRQFPLVCLDSGRRVVSDTAADIHGIVDGVGITSYRLRSFPNLRNHW